MKIIGAGIAGLIAANMLRHKKPIVYERQGSLPNNHSAVLRFRSHVIGDVTGIEFKKVTVIKSSLPWRNPVADALAYADKNTGLLLSDRSIPTNIEKAERYIAPPDLIAQLAQGVEIKYGFDGQLPAGPVISTIPMEALMDLLEYPLGERPNFASVKGCNIRAIVADCDAYVSLYVPSPIYPFSRVSLTGAELIAEVPNTTQADSKRIFAAGSLLGIDPERITDVTVKQQTYSKIQSVDDKLRKKFIAWASDTHDVYSLGRYSTWRPSLLLDDLVQDIRLIERWEKSGQYAMRRHR